MCKALGIVNIEKRIVEGIGDYRPIGAASFMGRYRIIDYVLSNMANSEIDKIHMYIKDKPRSLIEHISGARQYNMNSKRGHIYLLGLENRLPNAAYNTDINTFHENLKYIEDENLPYVIIAPCNYIYSMDYNELLNNHIEIGADISLVYKSVENANMAFIGCDSIQLNKKREVVGIEENFGSAKKRNISLETYVMSTEIFKKLVKDARETSKFFSLRDIISERLDSYVVAGYAYRGYAACIYDVNSYYNANMDLKDVNTMKKLTNSNWPIYTKTNDSCPTSYFPNSIVKGSCVANGCIIKGTVINSVIGRNTIVEENAVVKDCVILADSYIGPGTHVEKAVIDKHVKVKHKLCIKGNDDETLYIKKYDIV